MDQDVLYFFEGKPEALPLYAAFEEKVFSVVDGVKVKVQKTQIIFFSWHNFAFVSILLVRKAKRLRAVCASKLEYAGGRAAGNMEQESSPQEKRMDRSASISSGPHPQKILYRCGRLSRSRRIFPRRL